MESSLFVGTNVRGFHWYICNSCLRIYIRTNIYTIICLIFIKMIHYQRNYVHMKQENFSYPRTLNPTKINDSTVLEMVISSITADNINLNFFISFGSISVVNNIIHKSKLISDYLRFATSTLEDWMVVTIFIRYWYLLEHLCCEIFI